MDKLLQICGTCYYCGQIEFKGKDEPTGYGCNYRGYEGYVKYDDSCSFWVSRAASQPLIKEGK